MCHKYKEQYRYIRIFLCSIDDILYLLQEELNGCVGYRQMWAILRHKDQLTVKRLLVDVMIYVNYPFYRSTVQMLLSILDGEGVKRRQSCRLVRRTYQNKVNIFICFFVNVEF